MDEILHPLSYEAWADLMAMMGEGTNKHTKGVWEVMEKERGGVSVIGPHEITILTCTSSMCQDSKGMYKIDKEEALANARMAAAAPAMHALLTEMLHYAVVPKALAPHEDLWEKARTLVAKFT